MRHRFAPQILVLALLLILGFLVGQWLWAPAEEPPADSFRVWWWERRELDVLAQVGLVFVGALGIAALMPAEGEGGG